MANRDKVGLLAVAAGLGGPRVPGSRTDLIVDRWYIDWYIEDGLWLSSWTGRAGKNREKKWQSMDGRVESAVPPIPCYGWWLVPVIVHNSGTRVSTVQATSSDPVPARSPPPRRRILIYDKENRNSHVNTRLTKNKAKSEDRAYRFMRVQSITLDTSGDRYILSTLMT